MSQEYEIRVRQNAVFPSILLVGGVAVTIMALMLGGRGLLLFIGLLNTAVGLLTLTRPMWVLRADVLEVRNAVGMVLRTLPVAGPSTLVLAEDGRSITWPAGVDVEGRHRKALVIKRWSCRGADWSRLVEAVNARAFE